MKKRILVCAESGHVNSGFGNYTREIISRLHRSGKYDVAELSCYRSIKTPKTEPWKIYPVIPTAGTVAHQEYNSNPINQFGQWLFDFVLIDYKPNIVFDFRDPWMFGYQDHSNFRRFFHWLIVPTYDSSPPKADFMTLFNNADSLMFHTHWAKKDYESLNGCGNNNVKGVLSDSVDVDQFKPISYTKSFHKQNLGIPHNAFIIGSVMRNQKRKLIPDLFSVTKQVIQNNPNKNIFLYLHTSYPDFNGWDIPSLILEYGLQNHVLLTYVCRNCKKFHVSRFQTAFNGCPFCNNICGISGVGEGVTTQQLVEVYNTFDVYVQYSICEGFGIPQVEAAACGVPVITMNHGAMNEVGNNIGASIVDIDRAFVELETLAQRVYPDNDQCVEYIQKYIDMDQASYRKLSLTTRSKLLDHYSWDKTYQILENTIDNIDVSNLFSWDMPKIDYKKTYEAKNNLTFRQQIYDILDNVLMDNYLKKTNFIEDMIKNVTNKFISTDRGINGYNEQQAVALLEKYMTGRLFTEAVRVGEAAMPDHMKEIIEYA